MSNNKERYNLLLLGNTGAGKSTTANTILSGENDEVTIVFANDGKTTIPKIVPETVMGHEINLIDTVGLLNKDDLNMAQQMHYVFKEMGVNAVLFVIQCQSKSGEMSKTDLESLKYVEQLFGEVFWEKTIFIATFGDTYEKYAKEVKFKVQATFEKEILTHKLAGYNEAILGPWVAKAKGGIVLFENRERDPKKREACVTTLFERVDDVSKDSSKKFHATISVPEPPKRKCSIM